VQKGAEMCSLSLQGRFDLILKPFKQALEPVTFWWGDSEESTRGLMADRSFINAQY